MTAITHTAHSLPTRQVDWTRLGAGMGYTNTETKRAAIRAAIEHMIAKSRQNTSALSLPVTLSIGGGRLTATFAGDGRAAEVWVVGLAKEVAVAIGRGENKGKTITYHNVARSWHKLTSTDGKTWSLPLDQVDGDGVNKAAVLVQGGTVEKPGLIMGAAMASIR